MVFRYPDTIQMGKIAAKATMIVLAISSVLVWFANELADFDDPKLYVMTLLSPWIGMTACAYYVGAWSDVDLNSDGISLEFLWWKLPISWQDIVSIEWFGRSASNAGGWLISVRRGLTPLHRLYSLFTIMSTLPGFIVRSQLPGVEKVLRAIAKQSRLGKIP